MKKGLTKPVNLNQSQKIPQNMADYLNSTATGAVSSGSAVQPIDLLHGQKCLLFVKPTLNDILSINDGR